MPVREVMAAIAFPGEEVSAVAEPPPASPASPAPQAPPGPAAGVPAPPAAGPPPGVQVVPAARFLAALAGHLSKPTALL